MHRLEHLNLVVGDMEIAKKFYVDFLGLSRDGNPKHVNLGQQQVRSGGVHQICLQVKPASNRTLHSQFHLAANGDPPQRVTGSIGLTVPNLQRIRERAGDAGSQLEGTLFSVANDGDEKTMTVTCPWGNVFHLYDISIDDDHPCPDEASQSPQKMVKMHSEGGVYGANRMAVRGGPGIRFVEFACRTGTATPIAEFYQKVLGCHVTCAKADATTDGEVDAAFVSVGPGVHLVFVENEQLSDDVTKRMVGVHACIYIPTFQQTYNTLKERDLIWTNPRFTHLDSCDTWDEAQASRTFRFKDVLDVDSGEKLLELEHETRPMTHGQYLKVPPYVPN